MLKYKIPQIVTLTRNNETHDVVQMLCKLVEIKKPNT